MWLEKEKKYRQAKAGRTEVTAGCGCALFCFMKRREGTS